MSKTRHPPQGPWSVPIAVDELPAEGQDHHLVADAATRDAIAALSEVEAIPRLQADFHLLPQANGGVHVSGQVSATVGQTCVVTLEPMQSTIEETVDLVFLPKAALPEGSEAPAIGHETESEAPEALVDGKIDLGALATEFLILGIDRYPRKAGAVFTPEPVEEAADSPFAALAALKKSSGRA